MFEQCLNVNEVKHRYRQLCFICHPDTGGDTAKMQGLNRLYLEALQRFDNSTTKDDQGKDHTYHYNRETEQDIMDKINELLRLKMKDVRILLVGYWIWISGNTKDYKDDLKDLKCRWHAKRFMWYWHGKSYRHRYSKASFTQIALNYGYREFKEREEKALVKA